MIWVLVAFLRELSKDRRKTLGINVVHLMSPTQSDASYRPQFTVVAGGRERSHRKAG
jgi:hypothetical protein